MAESINHFLVDRRVNRVVMKTSKNNSATPETRQSSADGVTHLDILKKIRIVMRAAQRHSAWIEKQCGVSGAQLWIMQELREEPGLRVGEIAIRLAVHQTTVSNLLDSLLKQGYVVKKKDPKDQRAIQLTLSKQGAELLKRAPKPARGLLQEALRNLDSQSLLQLDEGLQHLLDSIGMLDEKHGSQLPFFNF